MGTPFNNFSQTDPVFKAAVSPLNQGRIDSGTENIVVNILDWPDEKRMKILLSKMVKATVGCDPNEIISDEIGEELFKGGLQSGLEAFVVSFEISGLSRALTHQLVRTRKATFHQQSLRYVYMGENFNVRMPQKIADNPEARRIFEEYVENARRAYQQLCELNIDFQDARFVCPIGTETYIVAEFPLKVFMDTYAYRACPMMLWENTFVFREMRKQLLEKLPFLEPFIKITCEKTKKCMFQGWESTDGACDFEWNRERVFKSKFFTPEGN